MESTTSLKCSYPRACRLFVLRLLPWFLPVFSRLVLTSCIDGSAPGEDNFGRVKRQGRKDREDKVHDSIVVSSLVQRGSVTPWHKFALCLILKLNTTSLIVFISEMNGPCATIAKHNESAVSESDSLPILETRKWLDSPSLGLPRSEARKLEPRVWLSNLIPASPYIHTEWFLGYPIYI